MRDGDGKGEAGKEGKKGVGASSVKEEVGEEGKE